jgi:hypothetical protein
VTSIPGITKGDAAQVILVLTEDGLSSSVTRGENAGRQLPHTAVVREFQVLGIIDPAKPPLRFTGKGELHRNETWRREKLKLIGLVQERYARRVLAATSATLPER